jgi:hypothetical protein
VRQLIARIGDALRRRLKERAAPGAGEGVLEALLAERDAR